MKIAILGAGVSGMALGRQLQKAGCEVTLYERSDVVGGIARTRSVNNETYHITGGHCFNSKYQDVLDFVFSEILPEKEWNLIQRRSSIFFKNNFISYPIEYAVKEIAEFDFDLAKRIIEDYYKTEDAAVDNLAQWFEMKFGKTLAEEYFIPYNQKIWNQSPYAMSPSWVEDKLPIPDKGGFTKALLYSNKDDMPHGKFYYPKSNNQNQFLEALGQGLNIIFGKNVTKIDKASDGCWFIDDDRSTKFDRIVSTLPLNVLPSLITNVKSEVVEAAKLLKYNKVTTMLWRTSGTNDTWTYYPGSESIFHRHIHIGNFFKPSTNITITEAVGERSYDEMVNNGQSYPYLIEPLSYHVSNHAYVVFDSNYDECKKTIAKYLEDVGIETLGRFGEWEYYNMDVCIKKAIDMANKIGSK